MLQNGSTDRSVQEKIRNDRIKNAESDLAKVLEGLAQEKDRFVADCKSKESLFANLSGKVGKECEKEYETKFKKRDEEMKSQALVAKERKIENAKRDFEESGRRFVHVDQDIEDAKMQSYYRWFSDLEKQQHCFTHREEKDCKELGAIKFMGPFYAKNAAKVKLKDICGVDQYAY